MSGFLPALAVKVAVVLNAEVTDTVQVVLDPVHAPLHPVKLEPDTGAAVKVTLVPWLNGDEHVLPQLMPAGEDVTEPEPVPALETVTA